jgi:hypothetical protein
MNYFNSRLNEMIFDTSTIYILRGFNNTLKNLEIKIERLFFPIVRTILIPLAQRLFRNI